MSSDRPNHSFLATVPESKRAFILKMLLEGRLLSSADLADNGKIIRVVFGPRDAAISPYF